MKQNNKLRIYIYAMSPFIIGIGIFAFKMIKTFEQISNKVGEEKTNLLAQGLATSLWFPITGLSLTFIWLMTLLIKNISTKSDPA